MWVRVQSTAKSRILAHRGCWSDKVAPNGHEALKIAISSGFGLELDVRDFDNKLVISHDPPSQSTDVQSIGSLFEILNDTDHQATLAINIKSDGLLPLLRELNVPSPHFYFDMSFPEFMKYAKAGLPVACRVSEMETAQTLGLGSHFQPQFWWVDSLTRNWITNEKKVNQIIRMPGTKAIVSPELHGREHQEFWNLVRPHFLESEDLLVCTDLPNEFLRFCGL